RPHRQARDELRARADVRLPGPLLGAGLRDQRARNRARRRNHLRRNCDPRPARAGHDALARQRQLVDAEVDADRASHPAPEASTQDRGPTDTRRMMGRQRGSPMQNTPPYPLQLTAELSPRLSRWLWLVKWLLAV